MLKLSLRKLLMLLTLVGLTLRWQMDRLHQLKALTSQVRLEQVTTSSLKP